MYIYIYIYTSQNAFYKAVLIVHDGRTTTTRIYKIAVREFFWGSSIMCVIKDVQQKSTETKVICLQLYSDLRDFLKPINK